MPTRRYAHLCLAGTRAGVGSGEVWRGSSATSNVAPGSTKARPDDVCHVCLIRVAAIQPTNHGHETLVSRGTLEDGRTFEFRYNEKFLLETEEHVFPNVKIDFK